MGKKWYNSSNKILFEQFLDKYMTPLLPVWNYILMFGESLVNRGNSIVSYNENKTTFFRDQQFVLSADKKH